MMEVKKSYFDENGKQTGCNSIGMEKSFFYDDNEAKEYCAKLNAKNNIPNMRYITIQV